MDLADRDRQHLVAVNQRSKSTSFLERRLSSLNILRRAGGESSEQIRGPLGLNLLWEPSDPLIDFIFVHGLGGGSRKTWSVSDNPAHYWPKEWLPHEPKFKNVRIHSYGYNSDWGERKSSVLNVHDFGQSLLAEIDSSPLIRRDGDTPVVLIGHSMGGLVIKKAYLLAKQDPNYHALGVRFHSLFFLATPHRGADSAQLLNRVLRVSMPLEPKSYVSDLIPNSGAIQIINDEFRHVYQGTNIWSFFETVKTNLVVSQELIVEKGSASIGLPNERIQLLNADHRHVCKFDEPTDSNYLAIRNALASTVDLIEREWSTSRRDEHRSQMKILSQFLGVSEWPEGELSSLIDKRMEGTCQWLTEKAYFRSWQEAREDASRHFWLNGKPATGKSTLSAHVVNYLESCGSDCSYYFFKHGDKASSSISDLLRSLAFQMAFTNIKVRQVLLELQQDGEAFSKEDERTIWRMMFVTRIFKIEFNRPQYWVIDALDECRNYKAFLPMLSKVDKGLPLNVFITSRPSHTVERLFVQEKLAVITEQIKTEDSQRDIRTFLEANSSFLPVDDDNVSDLIQSILDKSNGCFLWATLVLRELESIHSQQQIWEVLKEVPTEMDDLYTRILDGMIAFSRDTKLAKAIFRWTVCAVRPLTVEELKEALKLDINETFPRLEKSIESVCGNLVQVDKQSRVQVVHQTVRAFLLKDDLESEFAVDKVQENSRLAEICLRYLGGDEMKSPRNRKKSAGRRPLKRSLFVEYASSCFSGHIARSSSSVDTHFILLEAFLKSNILTWIELIAQKGNLSLLTQTARNLKTFLKRRAKYRSPLGQAVQAVDSWANDLIHLVAAYGKSLVGSPNSIYSLIPAVCPPRSMLYKTFGNSQPCLKVVGSSENDWDDRLSCIVFPEERTTAIACQDTRFVVGLANGTISVYYTSTLQEANRLQHEEPVRQLQFANLDTLIASSGRRKVKLWNAISGVQLWMAEHKNDILTLQFTEDDRLLMAATRTNQLAYWAIEDGKELDTSPIHETMPDGQSAYRPPATHAQYSLGLNLLAIAHRQRPISFWDLASNSFIGQFHMSGSNTYPGPLVVSLVFNPNPDVCLLAASYQEEYLVVLDPWTQEQQAIFKTVAHVLAASPDGKTLAAGDGGGTIQLLDFETLRLIYRITASDYNVVSIVFTNNNLRFFDIRNDHCNIWEPAVLVRQADLGDGQSENVSEEILSGPHIAGTNMWDGDLSITAMVDCWEGDFLFCGREDGSIAVFETKAGMQVQVLYSHVRNIAISSLCWNQQERILVSTDISGRFLAQTVSQASPGEWKANPLLDKRSDQAIRQIIISPNGKSLLLSTALCDDLWSMTGQLLHSHCVLQPIARIRTTHPLDSDHLLFVDDYKARIFKWDTFDEISLANDIKLDSLIEKKPSLSDFLSCYCGRDVFVTFSNPHGTRAPPNLYVWSASALQPSIESAKPLVNLSRLAVKIKAVIGIHKSSLLFLDHDGWVCSVEVENIGSERFYLKHFFIPYGWHSGAEPIMRSTAKGLVILARRDEMIVFQRGLEFDEKVLL